MKLKIPKLKAIPKSVRALSRCNSTAGDPVLKTYTADPADFDTDAELARIMEIHERRLTEATEDPTKVLAGVGPDCIVGFDSEYWTDPDTKVKHILSLQLHLKAEGGHLARIYYPVAGERPSLIKCLLSLMAEALAANIIREWPRRVIVGAFFMRADLGSIDIAEFEEIKGLVDSAGGRICTIGRALTYSVLPQSLEKMIDQSDYTAEDADAPSSFPRRSSTLVGLNGQMRLLSIIFRDIASHVAVGKSLDAVGEEMGILKIDLPEGYDKSRMDLLLKNDRAFFEIYAMTDAKIVAEFLVRAMLFCKELTGNSELPPTASSLAQRFFLKTLKDAGLTREECFGVEHRKTLVFNESADKVRTVSDEIAVPRREDHRAFVTRCYHGGINLTAYSGPTELGVYTDFDLVSCYTTAMVGLKMIDFNNPRVTTNPQDYVGDVLGFAHVDFAYPDGTQWPGLPVDGGTRGLLYPLRGRSHCGAPEIEVALNLGCKITIHHGVIYPWLSDVRMFEPFVREIRTRRAALPKGSVQEQLVKLIGNSLYGRTAMGLKEKRVFDTRSGGSVQLPPSPITNEVVAAHITSQVRATVVEAAACMRPDRRILSITTDGFISDCSFDELPLDGPMAQRYLALTERTTGVAQIWEVKHRVKQLLIMKTRGQVTTEFDDSAVGEARTILAKVGVSPPPEIAKKDQNEYMVALYLNRQPKQKTTVRPFASTRMQWTSDSGFKRLDREQALNLEPDLKRRLINPRMITVRGGQHLACDTTPWETAELGLAARAIFDGWMKNGKIGNCLKTMADWASWMEYFQFGMARNAKVLGGRLGAGIHMKEDGAVGVLRRMFLRAWARKLLGLTRTMTGPKLAQWMTDIGMPTTPDDVKNSGRATQRFEDMVVPRSDDVLALLKVLKSQFPTADLDRLLVNEGLAG